MKKSNLGIAVCLVIVFATGALGTAHAQKKATVAAKAVGKRATAKKAQPPAKKVPFGYATDDDDAFGRGLDAMAIPVKVHTDKARLLLESGDTAGAKAECMLAFDIAPKFDGVPQAIQAERLMGEINYAQKNYREALRWFNIYGATTMDSQLVYLVALCYIRMGDYGNAKRYYSPELVYDHSVTTTAADLPVVHNLKSLEAAVLLAQSLEYELTGEKKKASDGYDAAARLEPTNMWLHARRAKIALNAGRKEEGLALLRKAALSKNPSIVSDARQWFGGDNVDRMRAASGIVDKPAPAN